MAEARLIHSLNALLPPRPVPPSSSPPGIHLSPPGRGHCTTRVVAGVGGVEKDGKTKGPLQSATSVESLVHLALHPLGLFWGEWGGE